MLGLADIITSWIKRTVPLAQSYRWRRSWPETGGYGRALHQAAETGDVGDALAMLHSGVAVNERDQLGRSPLHAAVDGGEPELVQAPV